MIVTKKMVSKRKRIFKSAFEALENLSRINTPVSVEDLWEIIHGSRRDKKALKSYKQAMREQKTRMISAGFVTDISVCGAIPPYNDLRVGKLIAMLAFSEEVSRYWNQKYAGKKSVIASQLAGCDIVRNPKLVAVATTGIYGRGNIQYDRISIGEGENRRRLIDLGTTGQAKIRDGKIDKQGPTTMNVSLQTWKAINQYCTEYEIALDTFGKFGEGTSPRIRRLLEIKRSLNEENEIPKGLIDSFIMNRFSRSIHVGLLDRKSIRVLLGIDEQFNPLTPLPAASDIVEQWSERWLKPLCERDDWQERITKIKSIDLDEVMPGKNVKLLNNC